MKIINYAHHEHLMSMYVGNCKRKSFCLHVYGDAIGKRCYNKEYYVFVHKIILPDIPCDIASSGDSSSSYHGQIKAKYHSSFLRSILHRSHVMNYKLRPKFSQSHSSIGKRYIVGFIIKDCNS